jgi:hypothetical protein
VFIIQGSFLGVFWKSVTQLGCIHYVVVLKLRSLFIFTLFSLANGLTQSKAKTTMSAIAALIEKELSTTVGIIAINKPLLETCEQRLVHILKRKAIALERVESKFRMEEEPVTKEVDKRRKISEFRNKKKTALELLKAIFVEGEPVVYASEDFGFDIECALDDDVISVEDMLKQCVRTQHVVKRAASGELRGYKGRSTKFGFDDDKKDDVFIRESTWYSNDMILNPLEDWTAAWDSAIQDCEIEVGDMKEGWASTTVELKVTVVQFQLSN